MVVLILQAVFGIDHLFLYLSLMHLVFFVLLFALLEVVVLDEIIEVVGFVQLLEVERRPNRLPEVIDLVDSAVLEELDQVLELVVKFVVLERNDGDAVA